MYEKNIWQDAKQTIKGLRIKIIIFRKIQYLFKRKLKEKHKSIYDENKRNI